MGVATNLNLTGHTHQYVPTLRTKAGEVTALRNLQPGVKQRTVPLFQITPSISTTFAATLGPVWSGLPLGLDGASDTAISGSAASFNAVFAALGSQGVLVLPVVDVGAGGAYSAAVGSVRNRYTPGVVLRVPVHDLSSAQSWLTSVGGNPAETDLLIDSGHIADIAPGLLTPAIINAIQQAASTLGIWRSITLTSSAAPKDASSLNLGVNMIPRRDWHLWVAVSPNFPPIHFGDYGIAHRDLTEPPGYAMANATVTPRYTLDGDWLVRKGRPTRGINGQPMSAQYHGHAQALAALSNFGQVPGCWGDAEIAQIAGRGGGGRSGSRETWVSIGLNRHICLVCHRLP